MISGFQNHLHLLYGLPNGWQTRLTDTSDILDRGLKRRRKREEEDYEERIAAQLLQERQNKLVIPAKVNKQKLSAILAKKLDLPEKEGEVTASARKARIKYLLLLLLIDD